MTENDEIDEIEALLPWFATGALGAEDARKVEAALARRPELQASLAAIEEDRGETIDLNESFGAPSAGGWARILDVVEAEPRKPPIWARIAAFAGLGAEPQRGRLAFAAIAAAVVILLQAGAIVSLLPARGGPAAANGFATASAPSASAGAELLVSFAPDARLADVAALLKQNDASFVDGPRAGGFYKLRVGRKPLNGDETAALVKTFASAPLVRMVLPGAGK